MGQYDQIHSLLGAQNIFVGAKAVIDLAELYAISFGAMPPAELSFGADAETVDIGHDQHIYLRYDDEGYGEGDDPFPAIFQLCDGDKEMLYCVDNWGWIRYTQIAEIVSVDDDEVRLSIENGEIVLSTEQALASLRTPAEDDQYLFELHQEYDCEQQKNDPEAFNARVAVFEQTVHPLWG